MCNPSYPSSQQCVGVSIFFMEGFPPNILPGDFMRQYDSCRYPTSEIDIDCVKINASLIMFAKPFVRKKKLSHVPLSFLIENYHLHKLTFSEKLRLVELTCDINWDLTKSSEISQDLLRSHKIYWELKRYRFGIWHLAFGIWQLICDMWHVTLICHDIILYNDINTIPIHFLWWILRLSQ